MPRTVPAGGVRARPWVQRSILAAAVAAGAVLLWAATPRRMGVTPDSMHYLVGAASLAEGRGYLDPPYFGGGPATIVPPLYPVVLALGHLVHVDPFVWARLVHALLLGANAALLGRLVQRCTGSLPAAAVGIALFLSDTDVVSSHAFVWSEALCALLLLLGLGSAAQAVAVGSRGAVIGAAAAAALAVLTRYAVLPLPLVGCGALVLFTDRPFRARLHTAGLYAAVVGGILGLWIFRNRLTVGNLVQRSFAVHAPTAWHWTSGRDTVAHWFGLPAGMPWAVAALLALCIAGLCVWALAHAKRVADTADAGRQGLPVVAALFVVLYVPFVLLSITFVDQSTPLDGRILLPAYVAGLVVVLCTAHRLLAGRGVGVRVVASAVVLAVMVGHGVRTGAWLAEARAYGLGFHARHWQESRLLAHVRALPADAVIYSNGPDVIYLDTGRVTEWLPRTWDRMSGTRTPADQFVAEVGLMHRRVQDAAGVIVYFSRMGRAYQPTDGELELLLPVREELRADDGVIYSVPAARAGGV